MSQTHVGPDRESTTGPRWVKVFGIITIILTLVLIILHLTGNNLGGHNRHTPPIETQQP